MAAAGSPHGLGGNMKVKILAILFILEALILLAFGMQMEGKLLGYRISDENNGHTTYCSPDAFRAEGRRFFHMPDAVIEDVIGHPANYTAFWVALRLQNVSPFTYYDLRPDTSVHTGELWVDCSNLSEGGLDLAPGETHDGSVLVIAKTQALTQSRLAEELKSLKISISAALNPILRTSKLFSF
jgi:hypothetical protein